MSRFNRIKTVQLAVLIALTITVLLIVFLNPDVYAMIASEPGVRTIAIFIWIILGLSFVFLYYDFHSYSGLRRENMELDNAIYSDALTGIANRYSVDVYISRYLNKPLPKDMGCVTLEITNLAEINKNKGHSGGDAAIQVFSEVLEQAAEGVCFIGRNGGNKFLAIFRECSEKRIENFLASVKEGVEKQNAEHSDAAIAYSTGSAFDEDDSVKTLTELVALSDRRAWQDVQKKTRAY